MPSRTTLSDKALGAFTDWFASGACVWQTTLVVGIIALVELLDSRLDPHGFWLLWALTLFSAVTQPALAHAGQVSGTRLEAVEATVAAHVDQMDARLARLETKLDQLLDVSR